MADLPTAIWSGTFDLLGVTVKCHTLSDGRRIVDAESVEELIDAMNAEEPPNHVSLKAYDAFLRWMQR